MGDYSFGADSEQVQDDERAPFLDQPYLGPTYLRNVTIDNEFTSNDRRVLRFEFGIIGPNETEGYTLQGPKVHDVIFWEPSEEDTTPPDDDPDKEPRLFRNLNRMAYVIKYFIDDLVDEDEEREDVAAEIVQGDGDSLAEFWDDLRENVVSVMDQFTAPEAELSDVRELQDLRHELDKTDDETLKSRISELASETGDPKIVRIKLLGNTYGDNVNIRAPHYKGWISDDQSEYPVSLTSNEEAENREWAQAKRQQPDDTEEVEEENFELDDEDVEL